MKTNYRCFAGVLFTLTILIGGLCYVAAQTTTDPNTPPTVPPSLYLTVVDGTASEPGTDTGQFLVTRRGDTNTAVIVYYTIGGNASNGVDYAPLSGSVTIPPGAISAPITIVPLDDNIAEPKEHVMLALRSNALYTIGGTSSGASNNIGTSGVVYILDDEVNQLPSVAIVHPADGAVFQLPTNIVIRVAASDPDGYVKRVALYTSTNLLANLYGNTSNAGFSFTWYNAKAGSYVLTARAYDNLESNLLSAPVTITVNNAPPPPTNEQVVVTVMATDREAEEIPPVPAGMGMPQRYNPGVITVVRSGPTNLALDVFYRVSGTASNGMDYETLPGMVTIPAGEKLAEVVVSPIDDKIVEGIETVVLTVVPPVCIDVYPPPPDCYRASTSNSAAVSIKDDDVYVTNHPPTVALTSPPIGAQFVAPAMVVLNADARDGDGVVTTVEFFAGTNSLGVTTNNPLAMSPLNPFSLVWSNVPAGDYNLTAVATDDDGARAVSAPVHILVNPPPQPPVVFITATDAVAQEGGTNTAAFRVSRSSGLDGSLDVFYVLSGTASNGLDYVALPGVVTIPARSASAELIVHPIDDNLAEGTENVTVTLVIPAVVITVYPPPPPPYTIGCATGATNDPAGGANSWPDGTIRPCGSAVASILDNDFVATNQPPSVSLVIPTNGAVFAAPANIGLIAYATDRDGQVVSVECFEGVNSLGMAVGREANSAGSTSHFSLVWSNVPAGNYVLTAKATDNQGAFTVSAPVRITVSPPLPVVSITATDAEAAEMPAEADAINTGTFTVRRTGGTEAALTVFYRLEGTAGNGLDYQNLPQTVTIPAGAATANIVVAPIDDNLREGVETVTAILTVPQVVITIYPPPPPPYTIGAPERATINILDNDPSETNLPPTVRITKPANGMVFTAPACIMIFAEARDVDGHLDTVEFFQGTNSLGVTTNRANSSSPVYPFSLTWSNVPVGHYVLSAVATDEEGASWVSDLVMVRVVERITNTVPVVTTVATDAFACEGYVIEPYRTNWTTNNNSGAPGSAGGVTNFASFTNTACFTIQRTGGTEAALTVAYAVDGTASNGVDYVALPGSITIPAGACTARIMVVPIDDRLVEGQETVRLTILSPEPTPPLAALSNPTVAAGASPPPYLVGSPNRASASIADNDLPQPPIRLPDGQYHFWQSGTNGQVFVIEVTTDLVTWTPVMTNTVTDGVIHYVDSDSSDYKRRFYRAVPVAP